MKHIAIAVLLVLFLYAPSDALVYRYDFFGLITYSDEGDSDPYVTPGETTFHIFGMWGDLGTESYLTINGKTYSSLAPRTYTTHNDVNVGESGIDVLGLSQSYPMPLRIWHIYGHDSSMDLINAENEVNWGMFSTIDWLIYWIAVVPENLDPIKYPFDYWECGGSITSASIDIDPVPEPATLLLLSVGIVGIIAKRKFSKS